MKTTDAFDDEQWAILDALHPTEPVRKKFAKVCLIILFQLGQQRNVVTKMRDRLLAFVIMLFCALVVGVVRIAVCCSNSLLHIRGFCNGCCGEDVR